MDKSDDKKNRFNQKNQERFTAAIYGRYEEVKDYLPDGICKSCETVLVSQSKPPKDRRKIKVNINYDKLAKHVKFLRQHHSKDGDEGKRLSNYQN